LHVNDVYELIRNFAGDIVERVELFDQFTNKKTGKQAMHYKCAACKKDYVSKDVQVDHVNPVVDPATGFVSWDVYIDRLFCEGENLQVLCSTCHKKKTAEEKVDAKRGRSVVTPHDKNL
jgi:5-methylcytosine-specific restriction endonuclease McrA